MVEKTTKVIRDCFLIDGSGKSPVEGATVIIEGEKIVEVLAGETKIPQGLETIDAKGRTVMPGLMDAHVHLASWTDPTQPNIYVSMMSTGSNLMTLYAAKHAQEMLDAGFTTVRDLGGYVNMMNHVVLAVRRATEIGMARGPRILVAGDVSQTGGHLDMGLPAFCHRENRITADGPWEARKLVREMNRWGHDLIKTSSSGGGGTTEEFWWNNYTVDELSAIVDETHAVGKKVAVHAQGTQGIKNALIAGADTIEHGVQIDDEGIEMAVKRGAFLIPTLMIYSEISMVERRKAQYPEYAIRGFVALKELRASSFQKAHRAGVKIAMGTDTYRSMRWHWGEQALELELMANLGMSNMETIVASTKTASEALGIEALTGTIEKGKEADILLVDGNPLKDIKILQNKQKILMVMKAGKLEVDRGIRRST